MRVLAQSLRLGFVLLAALLLVSPATAYVPPAKQVAAAVAKANRAGKRNRALVMQVSLHLADAEQPVATGTMIADPSGRARLELREGDRVERHLRNGARVEASLDGAAHDGALRLPPLHLLQLAQRPELQTALAALGAPGGSIELGYDGELDAYVLGGRGGAALWVDMQSLSPARIDLAGGTVVRLGPLESHEGVLWPAWLEIVQGSDPPTRMEFRGVEATSTSPQTFRREWLFPELQRRP